MGGDLSLKLPFILTHSCINEAPTDSVIEEATHKMILEGKENSEEEDSKAEIEKDKQNNNGDNEAQQSGFNTDAELKSPTNHHCVADVLVNIENKIDRPKIYVPVEGHTEVRAVKPNEEELDLIVKYPGSDTWSDQELDNTGQQDKTDTQVNKTKSNIFKEEVQIPKSGFAENLKRAVCCIDRRRQS